MTTREFPTTDGPSAPRAFSGGETSVRPADYRVHSPHRDTRQPGDPPPGTPPTRGRRWRNNLRQVLSYKRPPSKDTDGSKRARHYKLVDDTLGGAIGGAARRGETVEFGWARYTPAGENTTSTIVTTSLLPRRYREERTAESDGAANDGDTPRPRTRKKEFAAAPPGTEVGDIDEDEVAEGRAKMKFWSRVEVVFTGIADDEQTPENTGAIRSLALDSVLLPVATEYEYKVVAQPYTEDEIRARRESSAGRHDSSAIAQEQMIEMAGQAEYEQTLVKELRRDQHRGRFRRPAVVIGARSEEELADLTHLIADAIGSTTKHPYSALVNPRRFGSIDDAKDNVNAFLGEDGQVVEEPVYDASDVGISAEMLRALHPIPENPLPGVPMTQREPFEVNTGLEKEYRKHPERFLVLGRIEDVDGVEVGDLIIPKKQLNKHLGVFAASGAGKTELLKLLAVAAATDEDARPVLFVDPKGKQEGQQSNAQTLAEMLAPHGKKVTEINPSNLLVEGAGDNPLDPQGAPLASYVNDLLTVLANAFGSQPGQDDNLSAEVTFRFLSDAIKGKRGKFKGVYERFGWDIKTGKPLIPGSNPRYPTLWELIDVAKEAVQDQSYKGEAQNIEPFLEQRLYQLNTGFSGNFFNGKQIDWDKIFAPQDEKTVTVMDISELDAKDQALIMGMVLLRKQRYLKHNKGAQFLTILDEINTLVESDPNVPPGPLTKRIGKLFATLREFKGGLAVAGQSPDVVPRKILNNIGAYFVMRNKGDEGAAAIKVPVRLNDDQLEELTTYPEQAVVMLFDGMSFPVRGVTLDTNTLPTQEAQAENPEAKFKDEATGIIEEEKIRLRRILDDSQEGGKLLALVDTITVTELVGLDKIRIDYDGLAKQGKNYFKQFKDRQEWERRFIIREAVERSVTARSSKILRPDIPVEDYIKHIEEEVHAAINNDPVPENFDPTTSPYALPAFAYMLLKGELTHAVAELDEELNTQGYTPEQISEITSQLPVHPESPTRLKKMFNGIAANETLPENALDLPGDFLMEQVHAIHKTIPPTRSLFLAKNSRSGLFLVDGGIGDEDGGLGLREAIDDMNEQQWDDGYADFLKELLIPGRTWALLYNEMLSHMKTEVDKRTRRLAREKPGMAMPGQEAAPPAAPPVEQKPAPAPQPDNIKKRKKKKRNKRKDNLSIAEAVAAGIAAGVHHANETVLVDLRNTGSNTQEDWRGDSYAM